MLQPVNNQVFSQAYAEINGSPLVLYVRGYVIFTDVPYGTEVFVEVVGLPLYEPANDHDEPIGPHGFHIHEHGTCEIGDLDDPFQDAGGHWNPNDERHGNHPGDFPVLFSNAGYARMSFFTNRFTTQDIIGKSVIIHLNPDDFRTQPAGDSGKRIACGIIRAYSY